MIISHMITEFRRFGVQVGECLYLESDPLFSREAIGKFLGLSNPKRAVNKIIKNHPYINEFSKEIKVIDVKSQLVGGTDTVPSEKQDYNAISAKNAPSKSHSSRSYTKRFFDLMGFFLIAQKSESPIAVECQILLARLGKMYMTGKLRELTPEEQEAGKHLNEYNKWKGYKIGNVELNQYMLKTGCSRATAFRHAAKIRQGESPFDKKWGNFGKPVINEDLGLKIRELFFANPSMTIVDIWRAIGKKPSYNTVKIYVNKLKKERLAAEGK